MWNPAKLDRTHEVSNMFLAGGNCQIDLPSNTTSIIVKQQWNIFSICTSSFLMILMKSQIQKYPFFKAFETTIYIFVISFSTPLATVAAQNGPSRSSTTEESSDKDFKRIGCSWEMAPRWGGTSEHSVKPRGMIWKEKGGFKLPKRTTFGSYLQAGGFCFGTKTLIIWLYSPRIWSNKNLRKKHCSETWNVAEIHTTISSYI